MKVVTVADLDLIAHADKWTYMRYGDSPNRPSIYCDRCGASEPVPLPLSITKMSQVVFAFSDRHRRCRPGDFPGWMFTPTWPLTFLEASA